MSDDCWLNTAYSTKFFLGVECREYVAACGEMWYEAVDRVEIFSVCGVTLSV